MYLSKLPLNDNPEVDNLQLLEKATMHPGSILSLIKKWINFTFPLKVLHVTLHNHNVKDVHKYSQSLP